MRFRFFVPYGRDIAKFSKLSRPINGILSDTTSAFTDQPRFYFRKHRNVQHHAMINLQPRIFRKRCYRTRVTRTPADPTTTASALSYFLRASGHSPNFFACPSPSCLILTFGRPSFADHPRAFFSSGDYSTALFWTNPTRFDLRETSVTIFKFIFVGSFLLRPYSRLQM